MRLRLRRINKTRNYADGVLEIFKGNSWIYLCDTLERRYKRIIDPNPKAHAVYYPVGTYTLTMQVQSPLFCDYKKFPFAQRYRAYIPRIIADDIIETFILPIVDTISSRMDIFVGKKNKSGTMRKSMPIWMGLMEQYLWVAKKANEKITLEIYED